MVGEPLEGRRRAGSAEELVVGRGHEPVAGVDVVDLEKEPDPAGDLVVDHGGMATAVGPCEQQAGLAGLPKIMST